MRAQWQCLSPWEVRIYSVEPPGKVDLECGINPEKMRPRLLRSLKALVVTSIHVNWMYAVSWNLDVLDSIEFAKVYLPTVSIAVPSPKLFTFPLIIVPSGSVTFRDNHVAAISLPLRNSQPLRKTSCVSKGRVAFAK